MGAGVEMPVFLATEMAKIEEGMDRRELMLKAGKACAKTILDTMERDGCSDFSAVVVSGPGNNGGDGYVAAMELAKRGIAVETFAAEPGSELAGEMRELALKSGAVVHSLEEFPGFSERAGKDGIGKWAVVDALFGTGLSRPVTGIYRDVIEEINSFSSNNRDSVTVFSIDMPSGISDSGRPLGNAVMADVTIAIGFPKTGLVLADRKHSGRHVVARIMVLPEGTESRLRLISPRIPERMDRSHKGSYGKALVVGGSANYRGAPVFAGLGFLKAGGGVLHMALPSGIVDSVAMLLPEAIFHPSGSGTEFSPADVGEILEIAGDADIVIVGNGIGRGEGAREIVNALASMTGGREKAMIVDGDGLRLLDMERLHGKTILTPHPGEFSVMTGISVYEIMERRIEVATEFTLSHPGILVLKSNRTVVSQSGKAWVNISGSHWLATPGSGDILAGVIAAMIGQGLSLLEAAKTGVAVHGLAGEIAGGPVLAREIAGLLGKAMEKARQWKGFEELRV